MKVRRRYLSQHDHHVDSPTTAFRVVGRRFECKRRLPAVAVGATDHRDDSSSATIASWKSIHVLNIGIYLSAKSGNAARSAKAQSEVGCGARTARPPAQLGAFLGGPSESEGGTLGATGHIYGLVVAGVPPPQRSVCVVGPPCTDSRWGRLVCVYLLVCICVT